MKKAVLSIVFLVALACVPAFAVTYNVTSVDPSVFVHSYSTSEKKSGTLTVTRTPTANTTVNYYYLISASAVGSASAGSRRVYRNNDVNDSSIPVYIYPTSNGTTEISTLNNSTAMELPGTISKNAASSSKLVYIKRAAASVGDGTYTNTFYFQLYTGSQNAGSGTLQPGIIGAINVTVTVALATVNVTVTPSTLNFGNTLVTGGSYTETASMVVDSSRKYTLTVASTNKGSLYLASADTSIPYTFTFDGVAYSLSPGSAALPGGSAGSTAYPLEFSITNLDFLDPGTYRDDVVFTVQTQ